MHFLLILVIAYLLLKCCTDPETRWEVLLVLAVLLGIAARHTPTLESLIP